MEENEEVAAPKAPAPKKKGGLKKIVMIALPVLLLGGGVWWMFGGGSAKAEAREAPVEDRGLVPFETFLVNLSDPGGNRFLKVSLSLAFGSEAEAKRIEDNVALMGHLRSKILELLTEQNAQALITAEGKTKLKDRVKEQVAAVLKSSKVLDVLFAEFVVQF